MKFTKFLTGVAAAALLTGAANAYDLVVEDADGILLNAIEALTELAAELDFVGVTGTVEFTVEQDDDFVFTTDDVLFTINLNNATFDGAFALADIFASCTTGASVVSGGGDGSSQVTLLISGLNGCDNTDTILNPLGFALDIELTGSGNFAIETNIVTDSGGTPVDGGDASVDVIDFVDAYDVIITPNGTDEVAILASDPVFSEFDPVGLNTATTAVLGTIDLDCDTSVDIDLAGTPVNCTNDVEATDGVLVTVTGDMTSFSDIDIGSIPGTIAMNGQSASFDLTSLIIANGFGPQDVIVTADGTPIPRSDFSAEVTVDLVAAFNDEPPFTGALDSVIREGTQVLFPWLPSDTLLAGSGALHVVRLSNLSTVDARVLIDILASSTGCSLTAPVEAGTITAGGELTFNSASIEGLAGCNFGRGDIEFTVEAREDDVTARRVAADGAGAFTEIGAGNVNEDLDG